MAATVTVWLSRDRKQHVAAALPAHVLPEPGQSATAPPLPETIAASGRILGVGIGDPIDEALQKLEPLRTDGDEPPDDKELQGRRAYRKLKGTDYDWIMVWAKADRVTRIRTMLRADKWKPFDEIGDVTTAADANAIAVKWNLQTPSGLNYRLIAQGQEHRANTVYMFGLE